MNWNTSIAPRATLLKITALLTLVILSSKPASALHSGRVDLATVSFANENNQSGDAEAVLNLNYKFETSLKNKGWNFELESDIFAASYPDFAFSVPEARLFYATKETEASIGRKKIDNINFLDEDWNLGVQTAFFRMDPFRPVEQGLTGLNYQIKTEQVFLEFFASPIFVPDQSPNLNVKGDGGISSNNPWVILPPERLELTTGGVLEIDYNLVEDSLPELLGQYQLGGRFGINLRDLSILGMYYNRPSRQLDFAVTAKVESGEDEGFINVQARPLFSREHFYGVQVKSTWMNKLTVKNGFYGIIQQSNSEAEEARFQTSKYDYFFISTGVEYEFSNAKLSLKHLLTNKKQVKDDDKFYFETSRFLFENAVAAEISDLRWRTFYFKSGAVYSYKEKTAQLYLRAEKMMRSGFSVYGYFNLINDFNRENLSSDNPELTPLGMQRYAALDNVRVGVSYVF